VIKGFGLLFSFLITCNVYAYSLDKIDITVYEFKRYIIPQLKNISNDFSVVTKHFVDPKTPIYLAREKTKKLKRIFKKIKDYCPIYLEKKCKKKLLEALKLVKDLEVSSLEETLLTSPKSVFFLEQVQSINKLSISLAKLSIHLENVLTSQDLGVKLEKNKTILLKNNIKETTLYYHQYLATQITPEYNNYFRVLWTDFIYPIEDKILFDNNLDYLKFNLTELNTTWHTFNMFFQKKNKSTPKKIEVFLNTINNRWRSILRMSLIQGK
jgi:hypothetical protein